MLEHLVISEFRTPTSTDCWHNTWEVFIEWINRDIRSVGVWGHVRMLILVLLLSVVRSSTVQTQILPNGLFNLVQTQRASALLCMWSVWSPWQQGMCSELVFQQWWVTDGLVVVQSLALPPYSFFFFFKLQPFVSWLCVWKILLATENWGQFTHMRINPYYCFLQTVTQRKAHGRAQASFPFKRRLLSLSFLYTVGLLGWEVLVSYNLHIGLLPN